MSEHENQLVNLTLVCVGCDRGPEEIPEYHDLAKIEKYPTATAACYSEEGTLNYTNGHFACTSCYINMGMPTAPGGWKAP